MVVSLAAHAQYDDMRGTVTLDDGDFEDLQSVLGISGSWHLLGFSVFCNHPSLGIEGKNFADTTYTSIRAWALSDELLTAHSNERGIAGVIDALRPLPIAEFEFDVPAAKIGSSLDAMSLVLRASKRLSLVAWDRSVLEASLGEDDFEVVSEHRMVREHDAWVEEQTQY